jgi:nucleolysin TIA-1/TIAR
LARPIEAFPPFFPNLKFFRFVLFDLHADWFLEAKGYNYGFVEYDDPGAAERAMQTLNGRRVHQSVRLSRHADK